jgi:lactate permease
VRALVPYLCLVALLVVTRMPLFGLDDWFADQAVELVGLAGSDVDYRIAPLVSPAIALAVVAAVSVLGLGADLADGRRALVTDVFRRTVAPAMALVPVLVFVQIFVNSTPDAGDSATMPAVIAERLGDVVGGTWPLVGPAVGALGSFVSGSATVSNLVFTGLVHDVAIASDLDVAETVALQMNGAAMGNMVALHNVIAALTVAGLGHDRTRDVLRHTAVPMAALVVIFGVVGWLVSLG